MNALSKQFSRHDETNKEAALLAGYAVLAELTRHSRTDEWTIDRREGVQKATDDSGDWLVLRLTNTHGNSATVYLLGGSNDFQVFFDDDDWSDTVSEPAAVLDIIDSHWPTL
ncbi:hypothetical protein EXE48_11960 [Halorubrum sp. ASP1]|uniref:hypothetical protein n=1 Tax=Halorubrum sp. ASP1 TaxID=2518114 RepID=UPI0010F7239D|nr:hypothetical protein [Halorubrum sp. ASP1]TKX60679.1 hypothetical protein EXE48_11960 [Halorubrum sp. ASP1]